MTPELPPVTTPTHTHATSDATIATGAVHDNPGVQPDSARMKRASQEFLRLRDNIKTSYTTLGNRVHELSHSLRSDRKVLGSRSLFRLVSYVADKIENICHLEKGRLTSKFSRNSPFSRQLDEQVKCLVSLRKAVGEFHDTVDQASTSGNNKAALTGERRRACQEKLDKLQDAMDAFRSSISYHDINEKQLQHLMGLNELATLVQVSMDSFYTRLHGSGEGEALYPQALLEHESSGFHSLPNGPDPLVEAAPDPGFADRLPRDQVRRQRGRPAPPPLPELEQPPQPSLFRNTPSPVEAAPSPWVDQQAPTTERLQYIPCNPAFETNECWHRELTTGKPNGDNPLFYREKQNARQCLRHSVNAFMGGPFFSLGELEKQARAKLIQSECVTIRQSPEAYARDNGIDEETVKNRPWEAAKQVLKNYEELAKTGLSDFGIYVPETVAMTGGLLQHAVNFLDVNRQNFGIPRPEITSFRRNQAEGDVLQFVREKQAQVDRMVVGAGAHYCAFRQAENGDWFMVDSQEQRQERISPLEFITQRVEFENHPDNAHIKAAAAGDARFEFLTFASTGDINPPVFRDPIDLGV